METSRVKETEDTISFPVISLTSDNTAPPIITQIKEFDVLVPSQSVESEVSSAASSTEPMYFDDRYSLPSLMVDEKVKRIIEPFIQTEAIFKHLKRISAKDKRASYYESEKKSVLATDLSTSLSAKGQLSVLLQENADILKDVTKSHGVRLYMVDEDNDELILHVKGIQPRHKINFKIGPLGIVAAHVAYTKEYIVTDDILGDSRFPEGVPWRGPLVRYVLCVPIVTPDNKCIAVFELYKDIYATSYTETDVQITLALAWWIGAAVYQDARRLLYRKERNANQFLFESITSEVAQEGQIELIIQEIMAFAKVITEAERGTFYIANADGNAILANVFCDEREMENDDIYTSYEKAKKVASLVIHTRAGVNIVDAALDDEQKTNTTFVTRSIMCMPLKDEDKIVGVIELLNKKTGDSFSSEDEDIFRSCASYISLKLMILRLKEKLKTAELKNAIKTDMIEHHIKASKEDIQNLMVLQSQMSIPPDIDTFAWYLFGYETQLAELTLHMFREIDPEHFTNSEIGCAFVLSVMKGYRDNPYHNFHHAFNVCHCMWNILLRHEELFSLAEKRALMVATLGHDIDHYGCTNTFLSKTNNSLYQLYPFSTLEHHHFEVLTLIMKVTNLYNDLSEEEYKQMVEEIKEIIIATDPVMYFTCRSKILTILNERSFDLSDISDRKLLKQLMVSACDLCGQCKPFSVSSRITENLYAEFYREGDRLKTIGVTPASMLNREMKQAIPSDQYCFLSTIGIPCMNLLCSLLPACNELYTLCKELQDSWKEIIELQDKDLWIPENSLAQ